MLSISNITSKHASNYYSNGDYYTKDTVIGEWYGKIADKLELNNKSFQKEDFENLLNGKLIDKSNNKEIKLQDKTIAKIHQNAVKNTLSYIEDNFIFTRTQKAYKQEHNILATLFLHNTSRELDPQLHTHCILHNVVLDENNNSSKNNDNNNNDKVRSAYFKDIFNNKKF